MSGHENSMREEAPKRNPSHAQVIEMPKHRKQNRRILASAASTHQSREEIKYRFLIEEQDIQEIAPLFNLSVRAVARELRRAWLEERHRGARIRGQEVA